MWRSGTNTHSSQILSHTRTHNIHLNDENNKSDKSMLAHTHTLADTHTCSGEISVEAVNRARVFWACKVESSSAASLTAWLLTATLLWAPSTHPFTQLAHISLQIAEQQNKKISIVQTLRLAQKWQQNFLPNGNDLYLTRELTENKNCSAVHV